MQNGKGSGPRRDPTGRALKRYKQAHDAIDWSKGVRRCELCGDKAFLTKTAHGALCATCKKGAENG